MHQTFKIFLRNPNMHQTVKIILRNPNMHQTVKIFLRNPNMHQTVKIFLRNPNMHQTVNIFLPISNIFASKKPQRIRSERAQNFYASNLTQPVWKEPLNYMCSIFHFAACVWRMRTFAAKTNATHPVWKHPTSVYQPDIRLFGGIEREFVTLGFNIRNHSWILGNF